MANNLKNLDGQQVLRSVYDETDNSLRVNAQIRAQIGQLEIILDHTEDTVRLGDGTNLTSVTASGELQVRDNDLNTTASSINGKLNSLGQKTASGSVPVVIASDQSPVLVHDYEDTIAVYSTISVTSSATEIKVGASPNSSRKKLRIFNNGSQTIFLGFDNSVTSTGSSQGEPLFKNQWIQYPIGPNLTVYGITSSGSSDVTVSEIG